MQLAKDNHSSQQYYIFVQKESFMDNMETFDVTCSIFHKWFAGLKALVIYT